MPGTITSGIEEEVGVPSQNMCVAFGEEREDCQEFHDQLTLTKGHSKGREMGDKSLHEPGV